MALLASAIACASDTASDVSEIAIQAKQIQSAAADVMGDLNVQTPSDDVLKLAEEVMSSSRQSLERGLPEVAKVTGVDMPDRLDVVAPSGEWVDIFVSRSLDKELVQIIRDLDGSKIPVRFVFRGIAEGQKINDTFADYGRWTKGLEQPPAAVLDPKVFRENNVTAVPHMVFMRDGKAVASVRGLSNPQWIVDAVKRGDTGDLGARGPVKEISERDLIALMKERAAGIDLESRKEQTVKTYWERASFTTLTPAKEASRRLVDPSVVVAQGLKDSKGNTVLPEGTVINPLELRPFTLRLVIFNPNRKAEVEWVNSLEPAPALQTVYMVTELSRDNGWEQLETIENKLDSAVFMLKPDVRSRFELRHTPSLVTADGLHFVVDEFAPKEASRDEN